MNKLWNPNFPFAPRSFPFFYGWIIVAGATFGTIFSIPGQTMGFSAFTEVLITELGLTRVQLSTAYFIGTLASGFSLPWLGKLFDQWGARRMVVASAFVTALVLFYLSQVGLIVEILSRPLPPGKRIALSFTAISLGFFLIRASAQGVLTMASRNAIGKWFNVRRGMASAFSQVLISFGFSFAPTLLNSLIERYDYSGAWLILGLLTLGIMVPIGWLTFRDNPEECDLLMDGLTPEEAASAVESTNLDMRIHHDFSRSEALGTPSFWMFNLSFAFFSYFSTAFTFHIVSIADEFELSREYILGLFVPMAFISVLTNLFCGIINTRIRIKYLLLMMNLAATTCALGLLNLHSPSGIAAFVIGTGITGGAFVNLSAIVWPRFFGRQHLGAISGIGMSSMVIASAFGPIAFGLSKEWSNSYHSALLISLFIPTFLVIGSFWADNPQRKAHTT